MECEYYLTRNNLHQSKSELAECKRQDFQIRNRKGEYSDIYHVYTEIKNQQTEEISQLREMLWFLTVTCSCCAYLYFGSAIMLVTYFVNFR